MERASDHNAPSGSGIVPAIVFTCGEQPRENRAKYDTGNEQDHRMWEFHWHGYLMAARMTALRASETVMAPAALKYTGADIWRTTWPSRI
jgi:hypothetical protein